MTDAPIVLANAIGGYLPSSVAKATGVGQAALEMGSPGGGTVREPAACPQGRPRAAPARVPAAPGTGAWCPFADLEHADGAYEWNWRTHVTPSTGKAVDQTSPRSSLPGKRVASDIPDKLRPMNPRYHLLERRTPHRSRHWWIRQGTNDTDTSHVISSNLAAAADNLGDDVDYALSWDKGHATNEDPGDFIKWVAQVTVHLK